MNRVNERSLKEEHRKQQQCKAVVIDGVTKAEYEENIADLVVRMKRIQLALTGQCNYYGVSGNFHQVQNFCYFVRHTCFRILNKRHQKRSMKWETFDIIWNYYVKGPRLTKDIWIWQPKLI